MAHTCFLCFLLQISQVISIQKYGAFTSCHPSSYGNLVLLFLFLSFPLISPFTSLHVLVSLSTKFFLLFSLYTVSVSFFYLLWCKTYRFLLRFGRLEQRRSSPWLQESCNIKLVLLESIILD